MTENVKTNGFHFIAAENTDGWKINFFAFYEKTDDIELAVYINGVKTDQAFDSISFNKGDDVLITSVKGKEYPFFFAYKKDFIREFVEPLPEMYLRGKIVDDVHAMFYNCTNLEKIHEDLFCNNPGICSFEKCFEGCSGIREIPENLFKHNVNATSFIRCFFNCTGIREIPENLFKHNLKTYYFNACFGKCTGLRSIPENLFKYNIKVESFGETFRDCYSLKEIPRLFDNNINADDFSWCFAHCTNLEDVPEGLFSENKNIKNLKLCFKDVDVDIWEYAYFDTDYDFDDFDITEDDLNSLNDEECMFYFMSNSDEMFEYVSQFVHEDGYDYDYYYNIHY